MSTSTRLSNSKVKTWRRCPKKFQFKYEMGLRPRKKSIQLERGSWIHDLLMYHYDGRDWRKRHEELTRDFYNLFEEEREDLGNLPAECKRIMLAYLRHYRLEDRNYHVVDSELNEIVTLPNGIELNIVVDLVVEDKADGGLWIWDHKTRKKIGDDISALLDPQLTVYYWGLELLGYTPLNGVVYNELCTKPPTIPQMLKRGGLSKRKNIATDVATYMRAIKKHDLDPNDYSDILRHIAVAQRDRFFRRTHIPKDPPVLKRMIRDFESASEEIEFAQQRKRFPRTYIPNDCKWSCEYLDLCLTSLHGGDIKPMVNMNFERRTKRKDED